MMNKAQEKVLVAVLCGVVLAAAAGFAVQPAMAAGYTVGERAQVTGVASWDQLNVRRWPAAISQKVGALSGSARVYVVRCIDNPDRSNWCLIEHRRAQGWVNSNFLQLRNGDRP